MPADPPPADPPPPGALSTAADVVAFWCDTLGPEAWFVRAEETDRLVAARLGPLYEAAAAGRLDEWGASPAGALALVILFDQVPRNLYRDDPRAFATDERARAVARTALARGDDRDFDDRRRLLLLLPFEHSEALADQDWSVALFEARIADATWRDYAWRHRDLIVRFGRFPHRNRALGRCDTAAEAAFLAEAGAPF